MRTVLFLAISLSVSFFCASQTVLAASVTEIQQQVIDAQVKTALIQKEINQLYTDEQQLDNQYRYMLAELKNIKSNNSKLEKRIERQSVNADSIRTQLNSIEQVEIEIQPLMQEIELALNEFVAADLPFEIATRTGVLEQLKVDLADLELSLGDKYLHLLKVLKQESDYGQSIIVYQEAIDIKGINTQVNVYRLGRVALFYQTLNSEHSAMWSKLANTWIALSTAENDVLTQAISQADGVSIPKLLALPFSNKVSHKVSDQVSNQSYKNLLSEPENISDKGNVQ